LPMANVVKEPELSSEQTNAILRDRDGDIWVGTSLGLDRFQPSPLQTLSNTRVEYYPALASDPVKGVWIATLSHPVVYSAGGLLTPAGPVVGSSPIVCDDKGRLWLVDPIQNALTEYDKGKVLRTPIPDEVRDAPAQSIGLDRDGSILVSFNEAGFWRFDNHWSHIRDPGLPIDDALAIYRDTDRRVWLGYANGGIVMQDERGFHRFSTQQGGDLGNVLTFGGSQDRVWAAGANGLAYFAQGAFHRVSLKGSDALRGVSGVVVDKAGDLWLNTSTGIIRISSEELQKMFSLRQPVMDYDLFDDRQGVVGTATQMKPTPSAVSDKDGQLWFSTSGAVFAISPPAISFRKSTPVLALENVKINGMSVIDREHFEPRLKVGADALKELEINYVGIDLNSPEKVMYKYILEGEDKDWHEVGNRRQAFYSHLGPGNYRFRVLATAGHEQWLELSTPLFLTITPAFYQTMWFDIAVAILFLGLLYLLYLWRVRYVMDRLKDRLKERSEERLRIARELHDTLLQSVHGLMLRFHFATEKLSEDESARESLRVALSRADAALLEGRRRVQDLREEVPDAASLADQIAILGAELQVETTMAFRVIEDGQRRPLVPVVQLELCRIAKEAITNALQHSGAPGAEVCLIYGSSAFIMKCSDTGVGLPSSTLTSGKQAGHWGLVGMRERAITINGKLELWSSPGNGTQINVRVPAGSAYRSSRTRFIWLNRLLHLHRDVTELDSTKDDV
jgi:signal transduction histidine kinase/streptogramin lyase